MNLKKVKLFADDSKIEVNPEEIKRKKLIERIAITLRLQHNDLFNKNNYTVKQLISDIKNNLASENSLTSSYNSVITRLENTILKNFKERKNHMSKSEAILPNTNVQVTKEPVSKELITEAAKIQESTRDHTIIISNWSNFAAFKDQKHKDEDYLKIVKKKENEKEYFDVLSQQVNENSIAFAKEKNLQLSLINKHLEFAKSVEEKENQRKKEKLGKIKSETERMLIISKEKEMILEKEHSQIKEESIRYINDLKSQIIVENMQSLKKKQDLRNKCLSMMKSDYEELDKKRSQEKSLLRESKLKEKILQEKELTSFLSEEKDKNRKKIRDFIEGIQNTERNNKIASISKYISEFKENEKLNLQKEKIREKENSLDNEKVSKIKKMKEEVSIKLKDQMIEKKIKNFEEKHKKSLYDLQVLDQVSQHQKKEQEKYVKKRMLLKKLKEDWDKQGKVVSNRLSLNELTMTEKRFNKKEIEEMLSYKPPFGNRSLSQI